MAAVFIPVSFIGGSAGVFYKQFGLTLAIAIVISAVNALTLSPALCAIFLQPHTPHDTPKKGVLQRCYAGFNTAFTAMTGKYRQSVYFLIKRKWLALVIIGIFSLTGWFLVKTTPTGFVPNEDGGAIFADIILPPSASLERTTALANQVDSIARSIPEVASSVRLAGQDLISGPGGILCGAFHPPEALGGAPS
jgi:HAE1 family hydrophobic/amphiphilic exporter-1